jgi:hypothetical protein
MKLLAKTAEGRYQTAAGLERDLRRCLVNWEARTRIDPFALGEHDTPDRLLIPEKLYGRASEVDTLLAAFDRIVKSGTPELVLVSGYSGIGKSSFINELHKVLVPQRGLFASGKSDQHKRDIPYSTLVQAFQSLVRALLSKSDAELASWRHAVLEALGPNGQLIVDLVPKLKLIIGEQPRFPSYRRKTRNTGSSSCSGALSTYSHARNIRWRCSSTICNGSTQQRSSCLRICSPNRTYSTCC